MDSRLQGLNAFDQGYYWAKIDSSEWKKWKLERPSKLKMERPVKSKKSKKARKAATEPSTTVKGATVSTTEVFDTTTLSDVAASLESMQIDSETTNDPDMEL